MKKKLLALISLCFVTLLISASISSNLVFAEDSTANSGQALEIGPTVIVLTADPGETVVADIKIRNVSSGSLVVQGEINDFVASGEDGTPKILLDQDESKNNPYSIQSWISPLPELDLVSKQIETQSVIISVPENAAPGGYYGVVRFTSTPPELKGTGVSLSASLGSLVLLKVNGDITEKLSVAEFYATQYDGPARSLFETAPIQFVARIKNDGNIHETPTGQITVTDMFNNKIATVNVNLATSNVLPDSIRKFEQPLDSGVIGNKMLFGRYKAELKLAYGSDGQILTQTIEFWVIPYTLIAIIVVALIGGFFVLRYSIRRYNKHIVDKALKDRKKTKK